jgi:hypothetical protein
MPARFRSIQSNRLATAAGRCAYAKVPFGDTENDT